ncbi:MAG: TraA family conjugative transfer protein [Gammaproteobacteria bacterium]
MTLPMHCHRIAAIAWTAALVLSVIAPDAFAGTNGTEFQNIYTQITDWMTGFLGRLIAAAMVLVGIIAGVARQSLTGFLLGVGSGLGLSAAPTIINGIVSATLPVL